MAVTTPGAHPIGGTAARIVAFATCLAIPTSTAMLSVGSVLLAAIAAAPAFVPQWRSVLGSRFVIACLLLWTLFAVGILWTPLGSEGRDMLMKMHPYLLVPAWYVVFSDASNRRAALVGFATGCALTLALSLGSWLAQHPLGFGVDGNWTVFRNHIYHNLLVGGIGLAALAVILAGGSWAQWRPLCVVVLVAAAFDIFFLVQGRTGQVVFLVMLGVLLLLWHSQRGLVLGLTALLLALPVLWHESDVFHERFSRAIDEARGFAAEKQDETSVGMRLSWARDSLAIIADAPWVGHGSGSFASAFRAHHGVPTDPAVRAPRLQAAKNPHNSYLWLGVELGMAGVAALLAVFATALHGARHLPAPHRWWVWLVVGAMAVGSMVNSFVMDRPTGTGYLVLLCALLAGAPTHRDRGNAR